MQEYLGSCHCQKVKFAVKLSSSVECERCNCSICYKTNFIHLIIPLSRFTLLEGEEHISTYTYNTGIAKHTFCRHCGVKPFYTPRSNPDGISVNLHALDERPAEVNISDFDGQNWEHNAALLAHKTAE